MATTIGILAIILGASAWGVVWRERYSHVVGFMWSLVVTAIAGALTGNNLHVRYWLLMVVAMYVGGIVLRMLRLF